MVLDGQRMSDAEQLHPAINAALNLHLRSCFLVARPHRDRARRRRDSTRSRMLAAFTASSVFLVSYVIRFATTGAHKYPGDGWDKTIYLVILFSHMVLAVVLVPLVIGALRRALRGDFAAHKRIVQVRVADLDVRLGDRRDRLLDALSPRAAPPLAGEPLPRRGCPS